MWPLHTRRADTAGALLILLGLAGPTLPGAPASIAVAVAGRSIAPGELTVFTMTTTAPVDSIRLRAFGRTVPAFQDTALTWRALVGVDLEAAPRTYPVAIDAVAGGQSLHTAYSLRVERRRFPTRSLTVDEAFVNPPPDLLDRIAKEANELRAVWATSTSERLWNGPFVVPVPSRANSSFGTRSLFNGKPRSPHAGADFPSPTGTPIEAPNAGRVVVARNLYFTGNTVVIDHGLGLFSMLAHLSAFEVREGDQVFVGQIVGRVGATGRVTGPHLHWAVQATGARVDPLSLLAVLGQQESRPSPKD